MVRAVVRVRAMVKVRAIRAIKVRVRVMAIRAIRVNLNPNSPNPKHSPNHNSSWGVVINRKVPIFFQVM